MLSNLLLEMPNDDFHDRSSAFLKWFRSQEDVRFSEKIELADFRSHGAGRGVGISHKIPDMVSLLTP